MGKVPHPHPEPEVTFFVESREESAGAESRGRFLLNRLGGADVIAALQHVRGRIAIALNSSELLNDPALVDFLREFNILGIPIDIWATLSDQDGYWLHAGNMREAHAAVTEIMECMDRHNVDFENIGLDLEFPIGVIKDGFRLKEYLRLRLWRFSQPDARLYMDNLVQEILRQTQHGVRLYEIPILSDSKMLRKALAIPEAPTDISTDPPDRFKRIGLTYTSVKPPVIGGKPEKFIEQHATGRGRIPALGIVSATDVNPGRRLNSKPPRFLTEAELQRDVKTALAVSPREFYVFALNGLRVIEQTRAAIEAAYADSTG